MLGVLLLFSIVISLMNVNGVLPYSKPNSHYAYEGLTITEVGEATEETINDDKTTEKKDKKEETPKIIAPTEGFTTQTFSPAPVNAQTTLDSYSTLKGSTTCEPSPYSNSQGYLCMSESDKLNLLTRGGNQTGRNDTIGSPKSL